jgi:hypothetical protein
MILYVNGDSHTAAAEAVNPHAFAEDDPRLIHLHRLPHPDNLAVSWGRLLSNITKSMFRCDAESAASNDRIIRTTNAWLDANEKDWYRTTVIIQWSTWEREEWLIDGTYYQVGASGIDDVPPAHQQRYKEFVAGIDWTAKTYDAHDKIWALHQRLEEIKIPHVFFNGNNHFESIAKEHRKDWGSCYIGPYNPDQTYDSVLKRGGYATVAPNSWHFGKDGHSFWAKFMLQYCIANKIF